MNDSYIQNSNATEILLMDAEQTSLSFGRAVTKGDIIGRFYEILRKCDPSIQQFFQNSDVNQQKGVLRQEINLIILYAKGRFIGENGLLRVKESNGRDNLNINANYYLFWKKSLIQALREIDPLMGPSLEKAWDNVISFGTRVICD